MSRPGYIPGDPWVICDVSGKQIRMSQSVKTWDGLRVDPAYWDPKHPQLMIQAVPDHMEVYDARPRGANTFIGPSYGGGAFTLISPNGTFWTFWCDEDGALRPANIQLGSAVKHLDLGRWRLTVDDDGGLHPTAMAASGLPGMWPMISPLGELYNLTIPDDGDDAIVMVATVPAPAT